MSDEQKNIHHSSFIIKNVNRRNFLQHSGLAAVGTMLIPGFLKAAEQTALAQTRPGLTRPVGNGKIVVIVQLSGGNDGLNTVVPYRNDIYYRERPTIAIKSDKVLTLNDEQGLNPALAALRPLYDQGLMAVLNNVGYPNPDRSHFRSMDIWQSASASDQYLPTGWVGRWLDATCPPAGTGAPASGAPHHALEVDDSLSLALKGDRLNGLALTDPRKLVNQTRSPLIKSLNQTPVGHDDAEHQVAYLYRTLAETVSSAEYVYGQAQRIGSGVSTATATYPGTELGRRLKTVSELIRSGVDTSVYYISIGGFDTHINQPGQQERLLGQYADAVAPFMADLKTANRLNDVVLMTFSEFGRRVKQNASNGTDHGTANNVFLFGGGLKTPGILNPAPNLTNLDEGDLKFSVDFRSVYATLLRNWLQTDDAAVLGGRFAPLSFV
jgi:uncharacterized protein (DUF1501 family)